MTTLLEKVWHGSWGHIIFDPTIRGKDLLAYSVTFVKLKEDLIYLLSRSVVVPKPNKVDHIYSPCMSAAASIYDYDDVDDRNGEHAAG